MVVAVTLVTTLTLGATAGAWLTHRGPFTPKPTEAFVALASTGLAVAPDGTRAELAPGSDLVFLEGSRVAVADPATATAAELATAQDMRDWLAAGTVPGAGTEFEDMSTNALLDLYALTLDDGAVVAGWTPHWRYAWPRDNAFVATALATTGHTDDALKILEFLQGVQSADGSFEARYLPDASGPPDDRGVQTDATGWALWSASTVLAEIDDPVARAAAAAALKPLIERSTTRILALTKDGTALPPASPDYWEKRTRKATLGTSTPLLMALQGADDLFALLGKPYRASTVAQAATTFDHVVRTKFGPNFPRDLGGSKVDTAVAFLLPPFAETADDDVLAAWAAAPEAMARAGGGLAPGAGWKQDGISWTPTTTVFALTAAALGEDDKAIGWLRWVDAHRTTTGSIPEKVLFDGSPAQLAPLAWSSANVLLALTYLGD
ncbi:hypothetical protein SAMN05216410_2344 [Sanguibacter gelidistatuariae]|uniref:Glucoamylase (Glucan-1,4-alpha-glucosidase), GH15 family n=1 Tax=Sanguibacter gelidistatuariae TaxID=1814289 RepID=A0A1G6PSM5_9MICO|nr:hypothetical protein SAMN05216410_2344 [Sanguibacter gelidistatuariae]